jgi:hypothetical protein
LPTEHQQWSQRYSEEETMKFIKHGLVLTLLSVVALWSAAGFSEGLQGRETNVVIMVCVIDDHAPYRIHVRSLSMNTTQAQMPTISTKTSCAQALHQFLTDGFEIIDSNLENYFKFVLIRDDKCR